MKIDVMVDTEALKRKYSPEGSPLRELQLKMVDELLFLDRICKENGLTYYLSSGTALGAVRHQGFIPWDDDLDIALPEKDYRKLVAVLRKLDSEKYVLHDRFSDFNYINEFPKFREKEGNLLGSFPQRGKLYKYKGVGVDIFCVAKNSFVRAFVCAKMRVALLHWLYRIGNEGIRKVLTKINWAIYHCLVPLTWPLNAFRKKGEIHYGLGQSFAHHYMWETDLFPVGETLFESVRMPIPHNPDAYLTHIYGDWRQLPSEDQIAAAVHNQELISE